MWPPMRTKAPTRATVITIQTFSTISLSVLDILILYLVVEADFFFADGVPLDFPADLDTLDLELVVLLVGVVRALITKEDTPPEAQ